MADRKPPAHMPTAVRAQETADDEAPTTTSEEQNAILRAKAKLLVELLRPGRLA